MMWAARAPSKHLQQADSINVLHLMQRIDGVRGAEVDGLQGAEASVVAVQENAQELYVTNGDGSIGVAYTYRNFTGTSLYYGISMTGRFLEAQLFKVRS